MLFLAYFAVLCPPPPQKVGEPTTWVQNTLESGQLRLFII